ncbi:TetR/AcrR family transcriptional regulator [uncultured Draconibacterium sp.]|uniref:TetR/AcrR family transcriptional regulator n=1 Tax=uncultured Draconibacterium sp. TaxID=1573823 RepID=UPI00321720F7
MIKEDSAKEEIVLKAQVLFQQYGLKKTTMDEIAYACGKAKSTLYHYFKSKEEVFDHVLKLEITNLRREVKKKVDAQNEVKNKIRAYFLAFHTGIMDKINLYRSVTLDVDGECLGLMGKNKDYRASNIQKFMTFERDYITRILEGAYDLGEFTKIDKDDIPFFSETLIAAFLGVMSYVIETDSLRDAEKLDKTVSLLTQQIFS